MKGIRWLSTGFLAVLLSASAYGRYCTWDVASDFPVNPPLLLDHNSKLMLPQLMNGTRIIRVTNGIKMTLACPGSTFKLTALRNEKLLTAKCSGLKKVKINGMSLSLSKLGCRGKVMPTTRQTPTKCGVNGLLHYIGFDIPGKFYKMIKVCFDKEFQTTLYTTHELEGAHIAAKESSQGRPVFRLGNNYFNINVKNWYKKIDQEARLQKLLGSNTAKSIFDFSKYFFAKGHISPDADFVTKEEQDATYYYSNALPQWQAINNGNWKELESATRTLAKDLGISLKIYSGGWGVLSLTDGGNNPVNITLGLDKNKQVVPAPALNWKVVHRVNPGQAVAIVVVNNPHITSAPTTICPDICSSLGWIKFKVMNLAHGYTYCCTVDELRKRVPNVPNLGNVGLLK